jgi:hypothetical protein
MLSISHKSCVLAVTRLAFLNLHLVSTRTRRRSITIARMTSNCIGTAAFVCRPSARACARHACEPSSSTSRPRAHAFVSRRVSRVRTRAADGASALTYVADSVIGGTLVLALARSGSRYTSRRDSGWLTTEDGDEAEGDDTGIRWTVASVVGCVPLLAWLAWVLPVISVGEWDEGERPGTIAKSEAFALAAAYLLAYAAHGFNLSDGFTWAITVLCAAHVQLEKTNAFLSPSVGESLEILSPSARTEKENSIVQSMLSPRSSTPLNERKGDETARSTFPTPRNSVQSAVKLGRALGKAEVVARQLSESIAEGKLQAEIEQETLRTEEAMRRQNELLSGELEEWDGRFRLRTMTRAELLELARQRGMTRYSKLNKLELVERLELEIYGS